MAAKCYWCTTSLKTISNPVGNPDEPIGVCQKCHVLSCGHHGLRDAKRDQFICVDCDTKGICQKALADKKADQSAEDIAKEVVEEAVKPTRLSNIQIQITFHDGDFATLEELKRDRPQYRDWLNQVSLDKVNTADWDFDADRIRYDNLNRNSKLLLIAAAVIAKAIYQGIDFPSDLPSILKKVVDHLKDEGQQTQTLQ